MKRKLLHLSLVLLLLAALCLTAASCRATGDEEIPENMKYATVEGSLYRLFVPSDWNLMLDMGMSGAYASMQNVAVVYVRDHDAAGLDARAFAEQIHSATITAAFPADEVALSSPTDTLLGGKSAVYLDYTGTRELVTYQGRDIVCVQNGRAFVLTFCTQKDVYEGYSTVRDQVTAAFVFHDTPYAPQDAINTVDPSADAPAGMMLASNDDVAYRLYVPDTWVLDRALPTSSAYVSEDDRSSVTVTVYMPEVDKMSAEEYWALATEQIKTALPDMTMVSTTPGTLDGRPANTYIYTATVGETPFRFAQTVAAWRGMVYTVTYTARDEQFDAHLSEYYDILAAFDFRGND